MLFIIEVIIGIDVDMLKKLLRNSFNILLVFFLDDDDFLFENLIFLGLLFEKGIFMVGLFWMFE